MPIGAEQLVCQPHWRILPWKKYREPLARLYGDASPGALQQWAKLAREALLYLRRWEMVKRKQGGI